MESKIKCDRQYPCSKCTARGKECIFNGSGRRTSVTNNSIVQKPMLSAIYTDASSEPSIAPSTMFGTTEPNPTYNAKPYSILESDEHTGSLNNGHALHFDRLGPGSLSSSISMPSFSRDEQFTLGDFPASASAVELYQLNAPETNATEDADGRVVPVNSHLSSVYASDMFGEFFSGIFNPSPSVPLSDDPGWTGLAASSDVFPFISQASLASAPAFEAYDNDQAIEGTQELATFDSTFASKLVIGDVQQSSTTDVDPLEPELQHYRTLHSMRKLTTVLTSTRIVSVSIFHCLSFPDPYCPCHHVWLRSETPSFIGCHASMWCTLCKDAKSFHVHQQNVSIRSGGPCSGICELTYPCGQSLCIRLSLWQAKNPTDSSDQIHLVLAVVLLQTIGLFHQLPDQRASSSIYHGMLVMVRPERFVWPHKFLRGCR